MTFDFLFFNFINNHLNFLNFYSYFYFLYLLFIIILIFYLLIYYFSYYFSQSLLVIYYFFYHENWAFSQCENHSNPHIWCLMKTWVVLTRWFSSPMKNHQESSHGSFHHWFSKCKLVLVFNQQVKTTQHSSSSTQYKRRFLFENLMDLKTLAWGCEVEGSWLKIHKVPKNKLYLA